MKIALRLVVILLSLPLGVQAATPTGAMVQARMDEDVTNGKPLIAHVVVALCDNRFQRIVPVPAKLGDGDDPRSNLYWGALYGVKTYFNRHDEWTRVEIDQSQNEAVLDRVAFKTVLNRDGTDVAAYVIAEAWRGRNIRDAIRRYLSLSAGHVVEQLSVKESEGMQSTLDAGGASHLVAYVGHNGLMDFSAPGVEGDPINSESRSSIVLACKSENDFPGLLGNREPHHLITTTGLMAPEAYSLEAGISTWFSGKSAIATRDRAADEYARYQKANGAWARRLFATED